MVQVLPHLVKKMAFSGTANELDPESGTRNPEPLEPQLLPRSKNRNPAPGGARIWNQNRLSASRCTEIQVMAVFLYGAGAEIQIW